MQEAQEAVQVGEGGASTTPPDMLKDLKQAAQVLATLADVDNKLLPQVNNQVQALLAVDEFEGAEWVKVQVPMEASVWCGEEMAQLLTIQQCIDHAKEAQCCDYATSENALKTLNLLTGTFDGLAAGILAANKEKLDTLGVALKGFRESKVDPLKVAEVAEQKRRAEAPAAAAAKWGLKGNETDISLSNKGITDADCLLIAEGVLTLPQLKTLWLSKYCVFAA